LHKGVRAFATPHPTNDLLDHRPHWGHRQLLHNIELLCELGEDAFHHLAREPKEKVHECLSSTVGPISMISHQLLTL
jgi:hypothetical protein